MRRGTLVRVKGIPDNDWDVRALAKHGPLWVVTKPTGGVVVDTKSLATGERWQWHHYDLEEASDGQEG